MHLDAHLINKVIRNHNKWQKIIKGQMRDYAMKSKIIEGYHISQ